MLARRLTRAHTANDGSCLDFVYCPDDRVSRLRPDQTSGEFKLEVTPKLFLLNIDRVAKYFSAATLPDTFVTFFK